jgi:hypothetical protein
VKADPAVRWLIYGALAAVGAVAAFAFGQSYEHIYNLGLQHAQHGWTARLLPLSVDLLIVAAGVVMWLQKQAGVDPDGLARWLPRMLLYAGIAATVGANVTYGLPSGWLSAVISAWPGAVFAGLAEMVMVAVRPVLAAAVKQTLIPAGPVGVPASSYDAAAAAYAASVAGGHALTEYQLHKRFGIARSAARKICTPTVPAAASLNGDGRE